MAVTFSQLGHLGRMGNSMFQIAAVIGYARKYKQDYVLPIWEYAKNFKYNFNQSAVIKSVSVYREKSFHYTSIPKYHNVDLYGYFQSIRYWEHCQIEIRNLFSPNESIQAILDKSPIIINTCAIHVRRTDYLGLQNYHPSLPLDYYQRAINAMKEGNVERFIVFSDDIEWCKIQDVFKGNQFSFINSGNDLLDFFIMCESDKFIIANSSFSWWASYLSTGLNKRIIAPKKEYWFGTKYNMNNVDDLYLSLWELV